MDARELRDHLVSKLQADVARYMESNLNEDFDLPKTQLYRGRINECRNQLKYLTELKL